MATYKQKLPRVQHVERDSEESEQEWVMFKAPNKPIERRLVNNVSDDEDWHVLSDTSPVEEGIATFESNSEFASGGSDNDSEHYYAQDEASRSIESFLRKMPSHDGTGNFFNATHSDGPDHDLSTSLVDSNSAPLDYVSSNSDQDNESLSRDLEESVMTSQDTRHTNTPISMGKNPRQSWITKFRNVFRGEDKVFLTIDSQEQTKASQQIYHKFAESASSAANFELGDLGNTNPIKVLANVGNENANSTTYTTVTTQFSSRLIMPKDPMAINFAPTISKDMLNEMISTENVNSADHQNQQSQIPSQSDKNSLLSTFWTTFCRITNNIIVSDDIDPVPNDFSHPTNLTFASSNHNTHSTGLASIITGENHYDTCYLPFGNHLTLSELCPSLHSYKNHYSTSSTPSTSSYNKRRNSITSSSNTARIFLTPVSSSTSLKSFTSRAGSDCGLESGRGMGKSTNLEVPLVL
ncbi:hypothetical protein C1645_371743 [Glomus cerebriforme]|uniref:Uncharacterized protein n=1 Tax=Glomus cerebriforme TaxID=658196 RepID=A0A397SH88_9GLOM|nr:hypothetical protein C1645_371743 [Glomus cerebriforme]